MERKLTIDVSHWDGDIDLAAWQKKRGMWAVIIKAGGNEGGRYTDPKFERNYALAKSIKTNVGVYYYTTSTTNAAAKADAEHLLGLIKGKSLNMPVYMDVEDRRQYGLSKRALTDVIKTFCDTIEAAGYKAGIYVNGNTWLNEVYYSELYKYADWIAWWRSAWPSEAEDGGTIGLWQQGTMRLSDGDVAYDDISGRVDCSWCVIDYPAEIAGGKKDEKEKDVAKNGTIEAVMNAAYGELGYYAPSDPKPGSKYGRWMTEITGESWLSGPSTSIWWCCMFVSWCLNKGGVKCPGFPTYNTDVALRGGARKKTVSKTSIKRGDIIIFDWDWNGATDHIGFATGPYDGYGFPTIEGNVGNAVKEKYRNMGNVAYVIRPDYSGSGGGGTTPSVPTDPKNNRDGGKLEVDGIGGWNTVIDLQHALGTTEDGVISGQSYADKDYHWAMSAVEYGTDGSLMVKALQKKAGATQDGFWGKDTSTKLQQWLKKKGYSLAVDGYFGHESVKALQKSLNDGKWS